MLFIFVIEARALTSRVWQAHVGGSSANVWEAGRMWSDLVGSGLPITPSALSAMAHVHCSHSGARAALDFLATCVTPLPPPPKVIADDVIIFQRRQQ
jgi:hypothetical protein